MPTYERPGVYSSYEVSSAVAGGGGSVVGVAALAGSGTAATSYAIDSYAGAVASFGAGSNIAELIRLLLKNGASEVRAVPSAVGSTAPTTEQYTAAFAVLMADADVKIMVCDSGASAVHQALEAAIAGADEAGKHRIGVVEASGTAAELVSAAAEIDSERIVLCGPTALTSSGSAAVTGSVAAALAGVIAGGSDPALPLNGAELLGLSGLAASWTDANINTLVRGGVTPVECLSGAVSVIRGVTTRTTTSGVADSTWRELSTVLIVDDVLPAVRRALRARFARAKNTARTRAAIRTQVIVELEDKVSREIIESYGPVTVSANAEDPTVCDVEFDFTVAHGLNQIQLTAHITV